MVEALNCPLCSSGEQRVFGRTERHFACHVCGLIHLAPQHRLDPLQERARYEAHENHPDDPRYREFLTRLTEPLVAHLGPTR